MQPVRNSGFFSMASVTLGLIAPGVHAGSGMNFPLSCFAVQVTVGGIFTGCSAFDAFCLMGNCSQLVGALRASVAFCAWAKVAARHRADRIVANLISYLLTIRGFYSSLTLLPARRGRGRLPIRYRVSRCGHGGRGHRAGALWHEAPRVAGR